MIMERISNLYLVKFFPYEIFCLILVGGALYWGSIDNSFHFDDEVNIWNNSDIQITELSLDELKSAGFESSSKSRPVSYISFALNYYAHGLNVRGFHAVNIAIHIITGILLLHLLKTTMSISPERESYRTAKYIPFFTALIWLINPVHTQSVTYIVQRMGSMGAMFFVMSLFFYAKARINQDRINKILFFIGASISGGLALGTKENTIMLPLFILLYEWYFFQDLRFNISWRSLLWVTVVVVMLISAVWYSLGTSPLDTLVSGYDIRSFTMSERLLTESRVILHYISLFIYPHPDRLSLDYDFHVSSSLFFPLTTILSILTVFGLLSWAIYFARGKRLYSFCVLWFLGNLVVESTVIPLEIVYEHRIYLPSMFGLLPVIMFLQRSMRGKTIFFISLMLVISLISSCWTYNRNKVWQNELTLMVDCQSKSPNKARTNFNLGKAYLDLDMIDEAIHFSQRALTLYTKEIKLQQKIDNRITSFFYGNLGHAYKQKGDCSKAVKYLDISIRNFYFDAETHYGLGYCYDETLNMDKAVYHLSKAVKFAEHHSTSIAMQAKLAIYKKSLENAKQKRDALSKSKASTE